MDNIEHYKKTLKELKDELYTIYFLDRTKEDYDKLMQLKNMDEALYEALLVLYGSYITSYKDVNTCTFKSLNKLIDNQIELANHIEKLELKQKEQEAKKGSWLTPTNITKLLVPVIAMVFALWIMVLIDDKAFAQASGFFSSLIGLNKGAP